MENHYITLENREKITISKVVDVDAFDEDTLWANLQDGGIELRGAVRIQGSLTVNGQPYEPCEC